jgi:hypothetical protein
VGFIVVYDANVLVGNTQRDLLVRIAQTSLVQAKWTDRILDEAVAAVQKSPPAHADDRSGSRRASLAAMSSSSKACVSGILTTVTCSLRPSRQVHRSLSLRIRTSPQTT